MTLTQGARLGVYEIVGPIGAGGMGEVYRARDTRLDRTVAIKVLPELFSSDPDRLARFEREAKTLASLNHPNIAQIFGTERLGNIHALAMEFVDGEDLSQRLERGALPLEEALAVARQIADALEAAHEQGTIHRDLKPANLRLRPDSTVKVLDFGLAKALSPVPEGPFANGPYNSPTFTSPAMTQMGMIIGTAAYMSPEQARGKAVDRRADIWAFGCLLYEMLTNRRPFGGDDVSLTLAAVLKEEVDFTALPPGTPSSIRRLLRRCLEKDPRKRLSSIGDARLELDEAATESPDGILAGPDGKTGWRRALMWTAAGALLGAVMVLAGVTFRPAPAESSALVRSQIAFPGTPLKLGGNRAFVIDPRGTEVVFNGLTDAEHFALYRRRLGDAVAVAIAGTEGAFGPFFSQDGQWLAFIQNNRLKKIPAGGGGAIDLGPVGGMQGGTFAPDGSVVFNPQHGEGLVRVPASGGERTIVTTVDYESGEEGHHWPHFLPDGRHLLYTLEIDGKPYSEARIMLLSLETGERRLLVNGGTDARYLPTGHIVYWREKSLWVAPFNLANLQVTGSAAAVVPDVMVSEPNGHAHFSVSDAGTLVYLTGRDTQEERQAVLVDRNGVGRPLTAERRAFENMAISPDGRRVVLSLIASNDSLWTMEMDRDSLTRITFEAESSRPVWSPDGTRIAFARHRGGESRQIFVMPIDGSTAPEPLRENPVPEMADSWTAHGNMMAFTRLEQSGPDIWVMDAAAPGTARPFLATRFDEVHPHFSPDGKWLAYSSNESGRPEVYVRPFPGPGQKRLVSSAGGTEPRWRGDGREIFYRFGDAVLAADVTLSPFTVSFPRVLFKGSYRTEENWPTWDVMPNGQGFLLIRDLAEPRAAITLVQNWFADLKGAAGQR